MSDVKPSWKTKRTRSIGWKEADQIVEELHACPNKSEEQITNIATKHDLSEMTIRKIAKARRISL